MATLRNNLLLLVPAIGAMAILSCDPSVIAPLPSPIEPDEDRIVTSSLPMAVESGGEPVERLVAIIGFDGAVEGLGKVRFTKVRTRAEVSYPSSDAGSFTASVVALPGDELDVVYENEDGRESDPIRIVVDQFALPEGREGTKQTANVDPDTGFATMPCERDEQGECVAEPESPPPSVGTDAGDPTDAEPGTDGDNATGSATNEGEDGGDDDGDSDGVHDELDELSGGAVELQAAGYYSSGEYTFMAPAGFVAADSLMIFANQSSGAVHTTTADSTGGFTITFEAEQGDWILMFAENPATGATTPALPIKVE